MFFQRKCCGKDRRIGRRRARGKAKKLFCLLPYLAVSSELKLKTDGKSEKVREAAVSPGRGRCVSQCLHTRAGRKNLFRGAQSERTGKINQIMKRKSWLNKKAEGTPLLLRGSRRVSGRRRCGKKKGLQKKNLLQIDTPAPKDLCWMRANVYLSISVDTRPISKEETTPPQTSHLSSLASVAVASYS